MALLVLTASDVEAIIAEFQPDDLQFLMARVFSRYSLGLSDESDESTKYGPDAGMPHRLSIPTPNYTALFMPARIPTVGPESFGGVAVKVVCVPTKDTARGLPSTTLVLDEATGSIKAVVNSRKLTAIRNAAGSLLSIPLMSLPPCSVVAFGAGQQVEAHLDLFIQRFSSIKTCTIINRSYNTRAHSLTEKLSARYCRVDFQLLSTSSASNTFLDRISQALRIADLIVCATSSTTPLFSSADVKTGAHVILIGSYTVHMREVDRQLIRRALLSGRILVDSKQACLREAGELIEAGLTAKDLTEVGELIPTNDEGNIDIGRYEELIRLFDSKEKAAGEETFNGPVTLFKSVGLGVQDVAIAMAVVKKALDSSSPRGTSIVEYD